MYLRSSVRNEKMKKQASKRGKDMKRKSEKRKEKVGEVRKWKMRRGMK